MFIALVLSLVSAPAVTGTDQQRVADAVLNVLFIGDRGHHQPEARLAQVYGPLLRVGFAIDWEDDLAFITRERLRDYDCVMMYANQPQHRVVPTAFMSALSDYVRAGGGLVALHCTSGCFMESPEWLEMVGARFVSHGAEIFQQQVVASEHQVMKGWANFKSWDETYVQTHHPDQRVVLAMRGDEPWTWVRQEGRGRVFYTASGHDQRTWSDPGFLDLLIRALDWCSGPEATARRQAWHVPGFDYAEHEWVPNYEERSPHPKMQLVSTPQQARAALIVPAGFEAQVFASEPMVVNPIAMAWDEGGRCWVVESPDYPNTVDPDHVGNDRISILEDTDGDGFADKKTVFKNGLNLPTSILKVKGGVIVTQSPDLLFLADTDGDDKCDKVEVLFSGFGRWDTHAGPSSLRWGPDNSIWGAVGYASFKHADGASFGSGLWRWQQNEDEPEFMAQFTNNTWGLGLRADGEVFGSTANGAPSFFMGIPKPLLAVTAPDAPGAQLVSNTALFHPALAELRQGDYFGQYTAAAGHSFASGPQMPAGWNERTAFICGPTGHLVGRLDSYPVGSGWNTRDAFNFCVSLDDWFCPVQAEVGPDGAVWIADFSQFIILHNLPGNPERGLPKIEYGDGNAHLNPLRDSEHGRIFRVFRSDSAATDIDLSAATTKQLVAELSNTSRFWRTTARRLLVEGQQADAVSVLTQELINGSPLGLMEALRTLKSFAVLDNPSLRPSLVNALHHFEPMVQKVALEVLPATSTGAALLAASGLLDSESPDLRRHALLAAARMPESDALGVALVGRAVLEDQQDAWLPQALAVAIAAHPLPFLQAAEPLIVTEQPDKGKNIFTNPDFELADPEASSSPLAWSPRTYSGGAEHLWVEDGGRDGSGALLIRSSEGADTSWFTEVEVEPNTRYLLAGWVRTVGLTHPGETHGALLNVHPRHAVTNRVQEDSDWTRVEHVFETGSGERTLSINCLYGGWGQSTGEAYYDDLELISLGPAQDLSALVELARKLAGAGIGIAEATSNVDLLEDGDAAAGKEVFLNNPVVACNRCHAIGGSGGGVGPDLTGVGQRLTAEKILESILDPNAELSADWTAPSSAMPALRPFLSDQQIRDLVAFLRQQ